MCVCVSDFLYSVDYILCAQEFWRKCGDLGLLGITAPCELSFSVYNRNVIDTIL